MRNVPSLASIPRVQISLINAYATHSDMLRGILDYVRSHASWALDLRTGRRDEARDKADDWKSCDGLIVNRTTPELMRLVRTRRLPAVLVSAGPRPGFPGCVLSCDNAPIVSAAVRHLRFRSCAAYAFVGVPGMPWSTIRAREVEDCCRLAGCRVPDDVMIVGVDNDETLCEMSSPTLSSIPLSTREAGYRAAEILDRAMRGELPADDLPDVTYTGDKVIERQSSEFPFAHDDIVRRCRELIAARFTEALYVSDLARLLNVSRRTLETRYRALTGMSVNQDILSRRIELAKRLLAETDRRQEDIALACGFCDASHLGALFRQREGVPPSAFRASFSHRGTNRRRPGLNF